MYQFDVVVLGTGCAGLATAYYSARAGLPALVLDCSGHRARSSIRNQGWLHSGALYVVLKSKGFENLVAGFQTSRALLDAFERDNGLSITSREKSLMAFQDAGLQGEFDQRLRGAGLDSQKLSERLERFEPLLEGSTKLTHGLITECTTIDNVGLINALADSASAAGCCMHVADLPQLADIQIERTSGHWRIVAGDLQAETRSIVCAAGVHSPRAIKAWLGQTLPHSVQKCHVLRTRALQARRLVNVFPSIFMDAFNVAPLVGGITINNGNSDEITDNDADFGVVTEIRGQELDRAAEYIPALANIDRSEFESYVCQKLTLRDASGQADRDFSIRELETDFFLLYPGKLSLSMLAGESLADRLKRAGGFAKAGGARFGTWERLSQPPGSP